MDREQDRDDEQEHRALAAILGPLRGAAAVQPHAQREQGRGGKKLDDLHRRHRGSSPATPAASAAFSSSALK